MIQINGKPFDVKYFNDGTFRLHYDVDSKYEEDRILWLFDSEAECMLLWHVVKHIKYHKPYGRISLYCPFSPEGRMDRVKHNDEVFTLKYFADFLNALPLYHIYTFDPHSHVTEALIDRLIVEMPWEDINTIKNMHPDATFFFCDEGAKKKYSIGMGSHPYLFGVKCRDWDTQQIYDLQIIGDESLIKDHDILICDDIVSRGTTLYLAAKQLKEMGAQNIYVWISHTENTVLEHKIDGKSLLDYDYITKIYTTNSIYRAIHPKIEVIHEF